ncbi:MAG: tannase/feruloyl esterase family alpha/beta hydrolase, partial [Acidobacteriota bacterium]|nr:tannase/feruloyl esterase family alpha/beta hydrolase [Acidobacteriota bacterium]
MRAGFCLFFLSAVLMRAAGECGRLRELKLANASVISARQIAAGAFRPADLKADAPEAANYKKLPRFCKVEIDASPTSDSRIAIEVWLPLTNWNGKFRGQGNGGFAGALDYRGLAGSLDLGYATAATDAGHQGEAEDASWALHHPEKIVDFGYRAIHETAQIARKVIQSFYGEPPGRAYFDACSDGGREALMEAQRFPEDYDGILAGAPANYWTHLLAGGLDVLKTVTASPANFIPPDRLPRITAAVFKA